MDNSSKESPTVDRMEAKIDSLVKVVHELSTAIALSNQTSKQSLEVSMENSRMLKGTNGQKGLSEEVHNGFSVMDGKIEGIQKEFRTEILDMKEELAEHIEKEVHCPIFDLMPVIYGDPKNLSKEPGLNARVMKLEAWVEKVDKLYWIGVGVIVVGALNVVWGIFQDYLIRLNIHP